MEAKKASVWQRREGCSDGLQNFCFERRQNNSNTNCQLKYLLFKIFQLALCLTPLSSSILSLPQTVISE